MTLSSLSPVSEFPEPSSWSANPAQRVRAGARPLSGARPGPSALTALTVLQLVSHSFLDSDDSPASPALSCTERAFYNAGKSVYLLGLGSSTEHCSFHFLGCCVFLKSPFTCLYTNVTSMHNSHVPAFSKQLFLTCFPLPVEALPRSPPHRVQLTGSRRSLCPRLHMLVTL